MLRHSPLAVEPLEPRLAPARAGSIDPDFATAGVFTAGPDTTLKAVAVQADGKVVLVGAQYGPARADMLVVRLNPDGSPDPTFGTSGRVTVAFPEFTGFEAQGIEATSVAVMADGRVVVGGHTSTALPGYFLGARLTPAGAPDPTFDADGRVLVPYAGSDFGPSTRSSGMAVDAAGRVWVVGTVWLGVGSDAEVIRLTADGQLDPALDADGRLRLGIGFVDLVEAGGIAVGGDGTAVAVGTVTNMSSMRFRGFVGGWGRRVAEDGSNPGGGSPTMTRANAAAAGPDGRVVIGGDFALQLVPITPPGPADFAVRRLDAGGNGDPTFGTDGTGRVTLDLGADDRVNAVALAADGRVVAAGSSSADFPVALFRADGTPDAAFNDALGADALGGGFAAGAVAFQGADVIVVGGGRVVRLRGVGTPDAAPAVAAGGSADGTVRVAPSGGAFATVRPFGTTTATARAALGDVNGDGTADVVAVTGPGVPLRVAVVSGADNTTLLVAPFDPFGGDFTGGGFVAVGDLDNDGRAEFVVTPDQGGGPRVSVFALAADGTTAVRANFLGIDDPNFRGGARPALGDIDGDGLADLIVAAGSGGGPRVAVYDGGTVFGTPTRLVNDFFAFPGDDVLTLRNGAFAAAGDVDGDGFADLIFGGGPGGAPRVFILSGALVSAGDVAGAQAAPVASFFVAGDTADRGGARVAVTNADGDPRTDVAVGSGPGRPSRVRVYPGANITAAGEPAGSTDLDPFGGAALADGVFVG